MQVDESYNEWAAQYDSNRNKTRDAEGKMLRDMLQHFTGDTILEMGCGTGKNAVWLQHRGRKLTCVDFSDGMLQQAKEKIRASHVEFIKADMTQSWDFAEGPYDLVTFSLVLEHIENLEPVLQKAVRVLSSGGLLYIGELHPFRQYSGSKARFETAEGTQVVTCYDHHISHFVQPLLKAGLQLLSIEEVVDDEEGKSLPRVIGLLFQKP